MKKLLVISILILGVCIVLVIIKENKPKSRNLISSLQESNAKYQQTESIRENSEEITQKTQLASNYNEVTNLYSEYTLEDYCRETGELDDVSQLEGNLGPFSDFTMECIGNKLSVYAVFDIDLTEEEAGEFNDYVRNNTIVGGSEENIVTMVKTIETETGISGVTFEMTVTDKNGHHMFTVEFNDQGRMR